MTRNCITPNLRLSQIIWKCHCRNILIISLNSSQQQKDDVQPKSCIHDRKKKHYSSEYRSPQEKRRGRKRDIDKVRGGRGEVEQGLFSLPLA